MVERAARAGYDVHAVFIGTRDAEINVIRVQKRVAENTGHAVDADDIRRRWHNAQDNLARTAHAFTRIDLYDNSGTTYRQIAVLKRHGIEQVGREPPEWARSLLERVGIATRMLQGELLLSRVDLEEGGSADLGGAYLQATYTLTGEGRSTASGFST